MGFRRPELEKDNPPAPQPYLGPRRRQAQARAAAEGPVAADKIRERLQDLKEAASEFVRSLPPTKKSDKRLDLLRDAIAQADRLLSAEAHGTASRANS
jgi:hypothetical protein